MFLLWSRGFSMCSLQISVLFVLMRVDISLFSSGILGSWGVFLLVKFLCAILLRMRLFCCIVRLLSVCIVSSIGRWSELSAWTALQAALLQSEDDMVVAGVRCLVLWSGCLC